MSIEVRTSPEMKTNGVKVGSLVIAVIEAETLIEADLSNRHLDWAFLPDADLRRVNFSRTSLAGANLSQTNLCGANFHRAMLMAANLQGAQLADADMSEAVLVGARVQGADFRYARFHLTEIHYARYDETTLWPEGFDPQAAGAKLPSQVRR